MKKTIIAVAVIAAGVAIGAPYITGSLAESETRKLIEEFNQNAEEYGTTNIVSYERGFRSSKVAYEYQLPSSLVSVLDYKEPMKYDCDYQHGITGIDYDCNLQSNVAYKQFVDDNFSGEDPLSITGAISAFGGLTQQIATTAIDKKLDDGTILKLEPSQIDLESDGGFAVFDSVAKLGALEISNAQGSFNMTPSNMEFKLKPTAVGLFEGDYKMVAGDLSFVDESQRSQVQGLQVSGTSVERGDKMDTTMVMQIKNVTGEGKQALSMQDVTLSADLLGLDSQALVEYQEFMQSVQAEMMASIERGDEQGAEPGIDPNQMMALLPIVEKMLDKNLNIKLGLSGKLMGKPNSLDLNFKLLEKTSFTQLSAFMFNPESVLENMDISLNTSLNKELIQGHPMAGPIVSKSPLFTSDDDKFETQIKLGAESSVNGKTVTFQELQGMVMQSMM